MIKFHLKQSKTDQFSHGADIVLGKTGQELCPVAAVLSYVVCRGTRQGPFFIISTRKPLTKPQFVAAICNILDSIGFPPSEYAGHSFRTGAVTSAALAGVVDSTIQLLGRWQSATFLQYVRTPQERLAALSVTQRCEHRNPTSPSNLCCIITAYTPSLVTPLCIVFGYEGYRHFDTLITCTPIILNSLGGFL